MSYPVLQLGNASNWQLLYANTYTSQSLGPRGYKPIPRILLPVQAEHRILVAGCRNPLAKDTWYLGGWLRPIISTGATDFGNAELDRIPVPLNNPRLILLPQVASSYLLQLEIPFWHEQINFILYQYIGTESDSTEVLVTSLKSQLDQIQSRVNQLT